MDYKIGDLTKEEAVHDEFKKLGFLFVTLDLKGYRTGSMNATLTV